MIEQSPFMIYDFELRCVINCMTCSYTMKMTHLSLAYKIYNNRIDDE